MEEPDFSIFVSLYREAYLRCFKHALAQPLTETESKLFYQQVLDRTGLTVGWRSLKNYSFFVLGANRDENPSVASMDTLARYVLQAPYTDEIARKNQESHHPYWFTYREKQLAGAPLATGKRRMHWLIPAVIGAALILLAVFIWSTRQTDKPIVETFNDLSERGLESRGWQRLSKDNAYWAKRGVQPGVLTLYTLTGDNWPDGKATPQIKNLLIRPTGGECFTTELELRNFIPAGEWQQAGLLLLQDTTLNSPSIRISLAFNDLFGGYKNAKEVLVQAITSPGTGDKPEEFAHVPVLTSDSTGKDDALLSKNLAYSTLRVEKTGKQYRFLYAGGAVSNAAFKEMAVKEIPFEPRYVAIFAIKGRVASTPVKGVAVSKFTLKYPDCK